MQHAKANITNFSLYLSIEVRQISNKKKIINKLQNAESNIKTLSGKSGH